MNRFLDRILQDLKRGENIDLILTLTLVIIISLLNLFGLSNAQLISSVTLATLGLIALGFLVTRYKIEDLYNVSKTSDMVQFSVEQPNSLKKLISEAEEIWLLGLTLRTSIPQNFYTLQEHAKSGAIMRFMLVDQDSVNMDNLVRRFSRAATKDHFRADFEQVVQQYNEIRAVANPIENIELRVLDFVPSFSLYIFPKLEDGGIAFIETYCYKSKSGSIPRFQVTEHRNPSWYKHFVDQFEVMWNDAKKVA